MRTLLCSARGRVFILALSWGRCSIWGRFRRVAGSPLRARRFSSFPLRVDVSCTPTSPGPASSARDRAPFSTFIIIRQIEDSPQQEIHEISESSCRTSIFRFLSPLRGLNMFYALSRGNPFRSPRLTQQLTVAPPGAENPNKFNWAFCLSLAKFCKSFPKKKTPSRDRQSPDWRGCGSIRWVLLLLGRAFSLFRAEAGAGGRSGWQHGPSKSAQPTAILCVGIAVQKLTKGLPLQKNLWANRGDVHLVNSFK